MGLFKQAVKTEAKLRMAITGPSGSGKTYTALTLATVLAAGKPIALVDTENGSASKYADLYAFDVAEMHPPFHPDKFILAIQEAANAGYGVIIIDSVSHAWSGTGGVLDVVDEAAKRSKSGNTYMAWKEGTPLQNKLIDAIVQSDIHVICTMRSKTEYVLVDDGRGKKAPKKVGMAPVQRDQFEYEFDVVFDMDIDNNGIVSKTRCPALTGRVFAKPGQDVADILSEWLHGAQKPPTHSQPAPDFFVPPAGPDIGDGDNMPLQGMDESLLDAPPWYAAVRDSLTNGVAKFATAALGYHRLGEPTSAKQYQYLVGLLDATIKEATGSDDGHKRVLAVLCQTDISANNPPSKALASRLLDKLATHKLVNGEKLENQAYDQSVVDACVSIWRAAEAVATPTLFDA